MKFKKLLVKIESQKEQNYVIFTAFVVNYEDDKEIRGTNLLADTAITDINLAKRITQQRLQKYTDKVVFI
jgi:hypothetical protein